MKYAIYQMDIVAGKPKENMKKVEQWTEQVVKEENPDVLVLPEMWTTAFTLSTLDEVADVNTEPSKPFLEELAKKHNVNIIGGSVANKREDGGIYNTAIVVNREGETVYEYDKIHLVPMLDEHKYLTGGTEKVEVFELDGIKMGVIICYDLRFPELARKLMLDGAQVLHIVAEWPVQRKEHWQHLQIARAIENQMFVMTCNRVGTYDGEEFAGTSMAIDPWGTPIKTGSVTEEETLIATIDPAAVHDIRKNVPIQTSRVPSLY